MRLLAFSDIHGAYDRMERALRAEKNFDAIVIAGDLTTRGSEDEARGVLERLGHYGSPILAVAGNMDPPAFDHLYEQFGISLNGRGIILGEVGFFGVSGSPPTPMHTPYEIPESEIAERAQRGYKEIEGAQLRVFVPHAPPHRSAVDKIFLGRHVGSTAVRELIEQWEPELVICGHIHEGRGTDIIGRTQIVNCGPAGYGFYAVITIGESIHIDLKG